MPTYEYRCPDGHEFEKFYRTISSSESSVACPTCGKIAERQLSAGGGLVFKGSGFYLTDYGKNAHATRGGAKAPESREGGGKSESHSDGGSKSESSSEGGKPATDNAKASGQTGSGSAAPAASTSSGSSSGDTKSAPRKDD